MVTAIKRIKSSLNQNRLFIKGANNLRALIASKAKARIVIIKHVKQILRCLFICTICKDGVLD